MTKKFDTLNYWETNYKNKRYNKYPFDDVVRFTFTHFKQQSIVLDLGCGGGSNSKFFIEMGHKVFAVDFSKEALNITKEVCGNDRNLICLQNNFKELDVDNNSIDLVLDRQSIACNELPDIKEIVNELFRILKPGGRILSFMYPTTHPNLKNTPKNDTNTYVLSAGKLAKAGLYHYTDKNEIKEIFYRFKIKEITFVNYSNEYNVANDSEYLIIDVEK